jgi:outer membrane protein
MVPAALLALVVAQAPDDGPLTVEAAVALALEHAAEMVQAREDRLLVEVDYLDALSAVLPRFDLSMAGGEFFSGGRILESRNPVPAQLPTQFPQFNFGPFVDAQSNNYSNPQFSLGLSGRQLIYDGGRWWKALERVDDLRAARDAALAAVRNRVRVQVVQGFYGLEKARQAITTFEAQLAVDRAQVDRARAIITAGRGSPADVATAERNLIQDEIQLTVFLRDEADARRNFNLLLGRSPQRPVRLDLPPSVTASTALAAEPVPELDDLLTEALARRPELKDLRAQLHALEKDVGIAAAGYWPTVSLDATYRRSSRKPFRVLNNPFENYLATLDLTIQWNLFEGRATEARVERARIAVKKQSAAFEALQRQTEAEVEQRRTELLRQQKVHGLALRQVEVAQEAVRLARGLFTAGRGTSLELRDAELRLTQARLTAINARLDLEAARADLAYVVGAEVL